MLKQIENHSIITAIILTVSLSVIILIPTAGANPNYLSDNKLSPIYEVSTRLNIPDSNLTELPFNAPLHVNASLMKFGSGCPPEIVIYIHGFNKNDMEANEEFNRIQTSLNYNNYKIPLIGFSWNSKVDYPQAQNNAKDNGLELAKFISDFKNKCKETDIRLVSHSLGAAVVNSTLINLGNNQSLLANTDNNNSKPLKSVHLLGAAINNTWIANNTPLGDAIYTMVEKFYNLYNPQDDGLEYNRVFEKHNPLGLVGAVNVTSPLNYIDRNVAYEIIPSSDADGNGNLEECFENIKPVQWWGDNHCGYIGFRNSTTSSLLDDGAMNIVVRDWINH
jgi:hypothetical protein